MKKVLYSYISYSSFVLFTDISNDQVIYHQVISVLFIEISNAQVIYHQVDGKGDYVRHAVRSWGTFFCVNQTWVGKCNVQEIWARDMCSGHYLFYCSEHWSEWIPMCGPLSTRNCTMAAL